MSHFVCFLMKNQIPQKTNRVLSLTQLLARKQQKSVPRAKLQKYNSSSISTTSNTQKSPVSLVAYTSNKQQGLEGSRRQGYASGASDSSNLRASRGAFSQKGTKSRAGSGQVKTQKNIKPLIPGKSCSFFVNDKREKSSFSRRLIDYKNTGLLQYYISTGGKLLPRRQTRLTAKQQRFIAKTVKSARIMCLLPFVSKDRSPYLLPLSKTSTGGSSSY
jgi:ribosomal protein S18